MFLRFFNPRIRLSLRHIATPFLLHSLPASCFNPCSFLVYSKWTFARATSSSFAATLSRYQIGPNQIRRRRYIVGVKRLPRRFIPRLRNNELILRYVLGRTVDFSAMEALRIMSEDGAAAEHLNESYHGTVSFHSTFLCPCLPWLSFSLLFLPHAIRGPSFELLFPSIKITLLPQRTFTLLLL